MLEILHKTPWAAISTGDESWISSQNPRRTMWMQSGIVPPKHARRTIASKKLMITVLWSANGMKSITFLPRGEKFTKKFFIEVPLTDFLTHFTKNCRKIMGMEHISTWIMQIRTGLILTSNNYKLPGCSPIHPALI
jgi:hypothetical protein